MQGRKQQLEVDMEQQTGSKLGKEYVKAVYCHPAFFFLIFIFLLVGWGTHVNPWLIHFNI